MHANTDHPGLANRAPAEVADAGKVRTGMGFKSLAKAGTPAKAPAETADAGKIRTGMGFKLF